MKSLDNLLRRKEKAEAKGFAFRLFFLLPLLISCASTPPQPTAAIHTIAAIPFSPLEDYRCGPSSLAAVLNFLVIVGYSDGGFIVNSGKKHQLFISGDEFLKVWKKADFLTLLVESPPENPR